VKVSSDVSLSEVPHFFGLGGHAIVPEGIQEQLGLSIIRGGVGFLEELQVLR